MDGSTNKEMKVKQTYSYEAYLEDPGTIMICLSRSKMILKDIEV